MHITLYLEGKEKTFTTGHVSAVHLLRLMKYDQEINYMKMSEDDIKEIVGFIRDVFDKQFTVDEFIEGVKSYELIKTITEVFIFVRSGEEPKERTEEGNEEGK